MVCNFCFRCLLWFHRKISDEPPTAITDEIARTVEEGNARAPLLSGSWDSQDGGTGSASHIRDLEEDIKRLQAELVHETGQVAALQASLEQKENTITRYGDVIAERDARIRRLDSDLQEERAQNAHTLQRVEAEARQESARSEGQLRHLENAVRDERARTQELERNLQTCIAEKEDALNRLSQMVSVQVRDSNAAIVDLSDAWRPEKLAEFSNNLYDNAWFDALGDLEDNDLVGDDPEGIRLLLDVVMVSFTFCHQYGKQQLDFVSKWMITESDETSKRTAQKLLKDSRKQKALENLPIVEEECVARVKQMLASSNVDLTTCATLHAYTSECIKLCWLMAVQDPPCLLVCPGWNPAAQSTTSAHGDTVNPAPDPTNKPALSTIYKRSSSQIGDSLDSDIINTLNMNGNTTATGMTHFANNNEAVLCDAVGGRNGATSSDKLVFDRSLFSDYTQRGKYVDYVVWPYMRMHDGGQILSKGIAQGCD